MTWSRILLCSAAALVLALHDTRAAPLDADTCSKLDAERLQLEFAGARTNMAKGPEWAKTAKLSTEALNQIRRLIDVDGQLLFRCTGGSLVNLPADAPDPDPAAAPREPAEDGKETPEQDAPAKAAPAVKPKPDTTKKAATTPPAKSPDAKAAPAAKTAPADKSQPAKKAPADKAKTPEDKAKAEKTPAPQAKAPQAKAKPKTDDAYKPPPAANPNADPFKAAPPAK